MDLGRKLQDLRRDRGWSQEALAEQLGVSRQAAAKWESGQALPELDNLVRISDLFHLSLDRLVRDPGGCGLAGDPGTGPALTGAVTAFLLRAKKATYAGRGAETEPSRPASHDLRYQEGSLVYLDTYLGSSRFAGEEALWEDGEPFWSMNYAGRVVGEGFSGDFLKEALALAPADRPYRGPAVHQSGDFLYHCAVEGSFDWFAGTEQIYCRGTLVYECRFHGGRISA